MPIQAVRSPPSYSQAMLVIGGNAVPLLGVLLWQWNVFELMVLYWIENIVIGFVTLLAMVLISAREGITGLIGGLFMGAFFTVHYGMFCMGHGVFVLALFYEGETNGIDMTGLFALITFLREMDLWPGFYWALAGIIIVQLVQLAHNWSTLAGNELGRVMMSPYGRIIILHITLIFGGMLVMALDEPAAALALLIVLKTGFDLGLLTFGKKRKAA